MKKICVVGSINMDYFTLTTKVPQLGEKVIGYDFKSMPGGKGANQAVAAARLGADVSFIGAVGLDEIGNFQLQNFNDNNINTEGIVRVNETSGIAQITSCDGDNSIIVVPGANAHVTEAVIDQHLDIIKRSDIVVLQMEIPIETIEYTIKISKKYNKTVVLNPAPWIGLSKEALELVDYITPNEIEASQIFGDNLDQVLKEHANKLIITQGDKGVKFHDGKEVVCVASEKTNVVDSTGAGDTFNGGFVYALANEKPIKDAIEFGNKVAALAISKLGAQAAMPTKLEYDKIYE